MLEYLLALGVINSLAIAPRALAESLARLYTTLLDMAIPRLRRVALRNLAMAMPELPPEEHALIVDGVFRSIARALVSFSRFPRIPKANVHEGSRYEGYEYFEQSLPPRMA